MSIHHVTPAGKPSGHTTTIEAGKLAAVRACMALVPGYGLGYFDETQTLLRHRLQIVGLIFLVSFALFLGRSIIDPIEALPPGELPLHASLVAILAVCNLLLW